MIISANLGKGMSPRIEKIGDATLYLGDCREILPSVGVVDHAITDPPYEREAHDPGRRLNGRTRELANRRMREIDASPLAFAAMTEELREFVCAHVARSTRGWVLAFCQAEAVSVWRDTMERNGCSWRRAMVWIKPDSAPQLSGDRPAMGYESIAAAWAGKGRSRWNGGGKRGVFTWGKHDPGMGHGGAANEHQTRKPIGLMDELVSLFTMPREVVLDPFMGSGTTGVACARLGRRFIGIEREGTYFDAACRRIEEAYRQPRLFEEPLPKPVQGSIFDEGEAA